MRHIIPTANGAKELFPELPSQQLRYYADILEEATSTDDSAEKPKLDEIQHNGKTQYEEYKG
ncbi:hypothetical protein NVP2275O_457 [Vibrio phage 2.275.O._10N.286.54.E11]|nr:hypothetical protein NVP2275O_457 [Vibrio phage 2.275.O._10N.286.54.E11]